MLLYLLIFIIALFFTVFLTPTVINLAISLKAVDKPSARRVNVVPMPRMGGIAIYVGFVMAVIFGLITAKMYGMQIHYISAIGILLSGSMMAGIGILDDIWGLKPVAKLVGQIAAALVAIYFGANIGFIYTPFAGYVELGYLAIPISLLWIVAITNAINLIDGLDGLASGVTAIAAVTLFIVAIRIHQPGAAIISIALAGAAVGFLRFNFFPAAIFLGDTGSQFLGFILATVSLIGVLKSTIIIALLVPVLILGIPIYDTLSVIVRRIIAREKIFKADTRHLHHRLLQAGFTQREAVLTIYIGCILLSVGALMITLLKPLDAAFLMAVIVTAYYIVFGRVKSNLPKEKKR